MPEDEKKKSDMLEVERRVYQIGLMLRRKPINFIIQYCADTWNIEARQARNYIRRARKEWKKYFEKLKGDGLSYHIAQIRDLKDQAYSKKVVIGTVDNKQIKTIADLGLVLEITKEEAKLMGVYPTGKDGIPLDITIKVKYPEDD